MTERLRLHPTHPQARLIQQAVERIRAGALVAWPTDSGYAFGWALDARAALERVLRLRGLDERHNFTLACRDLRDLGLYAKLDNRAFRLIRSLTPGPYTFILPASGELPRRLRQPKRHSVGLRIPDHPVAQALLDALGEPLTSSSLLLREPFPENFEEDELFELLEGRIDLFIDAGHCGQELTTVIDLVDGEPVLLRAGKGPVDELLDG